MKRNQFKTTCIIVGTLNIIFFLLMFSQGIMNAMANFEVPESLLKSPHYADSMFWVFYHMFTIGVLIIMLGFATENPEKKKWVARLLVVVFIIYFIFDIRTSDNLLGNALYKGPRSLFPVFIDFLYIILFLRLSYSKNLTT